jgi:hypothetical protein
MSFFQPTYGGNAIFGLAPSMQFVPNPTAQQLEAFCGVSGNLGLFLGGRGSAILVKGLLFGADLGTLNIVEGVFQPSVSGNVADGVARQFFDTRGRTWPNVIFKGDFQPDPMGPKFYNGGYIIPYTAAFHSLT